MKRVSALITTFLVLCQVALMSVISTPASASSANNFYFDDFTADYYLSKNEDGTSHLHVVEQLTAVFPNTDQNHGIERTIPITNQGGRNYVAKSKDDLNFKVQRNGEYEPVAETTASGNSYTFRIGRKSVYVHGRQTYTIEYDMDNVVTEFNENGYLTYGNTDALFQEIYWNTNGTGWSQMFYKLTANLHLDPSIKVDTTKTSCYVGRHGETGSSRCTISTDKKDTETVLTFKASTLLSGENLTFAVDFATGSFVVNEPSYDYSALTSFVVLFGLLAITLILGFISYKKAIKDKKAYFDSKFVAPQYTPIEGMTVAEADKICMSSHSGNAKVATLLELAISKKIDIISDGETGLINKKPAWKIHVNSIDGLTTAQRNVLSILKGTAANTSAGDEFKVEKHTATSSLEAVARQFDSSTKTLLKSKNLFEDTNSAEYKKNKPKTHWGITWTLVAATYLISIMVLAMSEETIMPDEVASLFALLVIVFNIAFFAVVIILAVFSSKASRYNTRTLAGLDAANYLEGLKLYISMAEQDRIKFHQSVQNINTSNAGIAKLYEKLLPYAVIFRLEKSWMENLSKYYEISGTEPTWCNDHSLLTATAFSSFYTSTSSMITSTTSYSSSSSSGGGGGGHSGGGGGGGGGGGW